MIPKNSRIPYSYTSFTDEDKEFDGFINKDKIDTIDFIELYDTESIEFIKSEFNKFKRKNNITTFYKYLHTINSS